MGKEHTLVKWGLFLALSLLLASWRWAIVTPRAQGALPNTQIAPGAASVEAELLLSSPIISDVSVTNVTTTTATVIWKTNVPADSTVTWRGAHCIFDAFVSTDEYIQAIVYAPAEYYDRNPAITPSELRAKITKDFHLCS